MLTCGAWVKRGVAKENPDKVALNEGDLKELLEEAKNKIKDVEGNEDFDFEEEEKKFIAAKNAQQNINEDDGNDSDDAIRAEYGLDDYDEEGTVMTGAGMAGLMYFASNEEDPYVDMKEVEEEDHEDYIIKKDDNLFVIGKMEEDFSYLEVYVYNEDEDSLYVHHDILLESFPLCLEWLSYDPALEGKSGNYVAVGTMEPDIQVWDLDVVDAVEPAFVLAGKNKKRKKKKASSDSGKSGHTDAVLGLAWNQNTKNVMASASADKTVLLWDMSQCTCVHSLEHHTDKVQSVRWHPYEAQSLLSGSFDKTAVVLDCRSPEVNKSWSLSGECEQVLWDYFSPYYFFASSDDGVVCYCDVRTSSPVFTLHAHDEAVSGISLSSQMVGCLATVSADKTLKVWDYKDLKPQCVLSREMKMGGLHFVTSCPDIPLTYAMGGEKDGLRVLNLMETVQGKQYFQNSSHVNKETEKAEQKIQLETEDHDVKMDTESTMDALATLTLKLDSKEKNIVKKKKKKK